MIKNRKELVSSANEWMRIAREDVRNKLLEFMDEVGTSAQELGHVLAISNDELYHILDGNGDISLSTFAKLLIATDNVLEIKPLSKTPFANMSEMPDPRDLHLNHMKNNEEDEFDENDEDEFDDNDEEEFDDDDEEEFDDNEEDERETELFNRLARERARNKPVKEFKIHKELTENPSKLNSTQALMKQVPFDELSKRELANLIVKNGWSMEIDLNMSSRGELIDFLEFKTSIKEPTFQEKKDERKPLNPRFNEKNKVTDNEVQKITELLAKEVARNPQLREVVKKYLK